jgi:hypothetical protein
MTARSRFTQSLPDNSELPADAHELADKWRAVDARLDEVRIEIEQATEAVAAGRRADADAFRKAILAGVDDPPKGTAEADARAVLNRLHDTEDVIAKERNVLGKKVRDVLAEHEDELKERGVEQASAALDAYRETLARTQRELAAAGQHLHESSKLLGLANHVGYEVAFTPEFRKIPSPSYTEIDKRLRQIAKQLGRPFRVEPKPRPSRLR